MAEIHQRRGTVPFIERERERDRDRDRQTDTERKRQRDRDKPDVTYYFCDRSARDWKWYVAEGEVYEGEPVWPRGKALGRYAEGPRFESASALLSLQKLWSVDTVL